MQRGSSFLLGAVLGLSGATLLVAVLAAHGCGDQDTAGTGTIVGTGGNVGTGGKSGTGATGSTGAAGGAGAGGIDAGGGADAGDAAPDVEDAGPLDACPGAFSAGYGCDGGDGDGGDGSLITLHPDAAPLPGETTCTVIEDVGTPIPCRIHLPLCTPVSYPTNPPSGGDHWPYWAAYRKYQQTIVPREMYVHNLEHGTIVLLYRCATACPEVVAALSSVFDAFPPDPLCTSPGPPARLVLTADPYLDTPIAAAAWGATYTATCIDTDSLMQFMLDHYAQGPEDFCTDGLDVEGSAGVCADAGPGGCF